MKTLEKDLIDYFSNSISIDQIIENIGNLPSDKIESITQVIKESNQDWENAPCDDEGPTAEQNERLDEIVKIAVLKIKIISKTQPTKIRKNAKARKIFEALLASGVLEDDLKSDIEAAKKRIENYKLDYPYGSSLKLQKNQVVIVTGIELLLVGNIVIPPVFNSCVCKFKLNNNIVFEISIEVLKSGIFQLDTPIVLKNEVLLAFKIEPEYKVLLKEIEKVRLHGCIIENLKTLQN
jgi:hypothetical protein